jgi:hypothetical protein
MHQKSATWPAKSIFCGWSYAHFQNSLWRILLFKGRHGQGLLTAKLCCVDENTDKECNILCTKFNIMAAIFPANPLLAHIFASIAPTCLGQNKVRTEVDK